MSTGIARECDPRTSLVTIDRTDFDPLDGETILKLLGLLAEPEEELPKTAQENRAIEKTLAILNDIRREIGLDPARLDPTHVHIQSECAFARQWRGHGQALMTYGHVYLPRLILLSYSLRYLTHELAHLASFRAVIDPELGKDRATVFMQSGLSIMIDDGGWERPKRSFRDLNEGLTEVIAAKIRRRLIAETDLVEPNLAACLINDHPYPVQVRLVQGLIELVGRRLGADAARHLLFADYFGQTSWFFAELARIDSAVVERLKFTNTNLDALAIAQDLGLRDAAADIERLCRIRGRR
ncbi:MAG: hypothetical protein WCT10_05225 [Patescibacteria group bacterium]|jgi:hypothetical protein